MEIAQKNSGLIPRHHVCGFLYAMAAVMFFANTLFAEETNMFELSFSQNGKFKVVQFTDTHFLDGNRTDTVTKAEGVVATISSVLDVEKPDLVIFTGDNVVTRDQPFEAWRRLATPVMDRKIPWAVVMGNHDFENSGKSQHELITFIRTLPYALAKCGPQELGGGGNYILPVMAHGTQQVKAALYCLDSGDYADKNSSDGYAWFSFRQIEWFRSQAQAMTVANSGIPLPSLAFFHIPFPEYNDALSAGKVLGEKQENVSCPKLNSGMFTAMLESKSILGTFVGHDHNNDYAASFHGICLAFGRKTGDYSYHGLPAGGARVIELDEGSRSFSTWIRTASGEVKTQIRHPEDFHPVP